MRAVHFSTTKIIWDFLRSYPKRPVLRRKELRSSALNQVEWAWMTHSFTEPEPMIMPSEVVCHFVRKVVGISF